MTLSNPIANKIFKMKFHGQKIKVRVLEDGERINSRCISTSDATGYVFSFLGNQNKSELIRCRNEYLSSPDVFDNLSNLNWYPSNCVGEKNNEHGHHARLYVEVLSPFFSPISDDSYTEPEEKGKADL